MSKPWFKGALDDVEPTPLAQQIAQALGKPVISNGSVAQPPNGDMQKLRL